MVNLDGYEIVISSRPSHSCELRLCAYLVSPTGCQTVLRGHNDIHSDSEPKIRWVLTRDWPGIPKRRDDKFYVRGIDPLPGTHLKG